MKAYKKTRYPAGLSIVLDNSNRVIHLNNFKDKTDLGPINIVTINMRYGSSVKDIKGIIDYFNNKDEHYEEIDAGIANKYLISYLFNADKVEFSIMQGN